MLGYDHEKSDFDGQDNLDDLNQHPQICAMLSALLFVDYQWCHVLFNNNTVSKDDDAEEEE